MNRKAEALLALDPGLQDLRIHLGLCEVQDDLAPWARRVRDWVPRRVYEEGDRQIDWAVERWIQNSQVGALVAAGGTGKTFFLLTLAMCHALGREFLGLPVKRGSFVLLSRDDAQEDLEQALSLVMRAHQLTSEEAARVLASVRVLGTTSTQDSALPALTSTLHGQASPTDMADVLSSVLMGIPDLVGVAFDTLRQFSGGSTNDERVIVTAIDACRVVAARCRCYVILPHHTGKQNYRDSVSDQYAGTGSAAIGDNCRFVLTLRRLGGNESRGLRNETQGASCESMILQSTRGSLLVRSPAPIHLVRDGFLLRRFPGTYESSAESNDAREISASREREQKLRGLRGRITSAVRAACDAGNPLCSQRDVEVAVEGWRKQEIREMLAQLVEERRVVRLRVPAGYRLRNNSKQYWFVLLSDVEREEYLSTGALPREMLLPPPSLVTLRNVDV